VLSKVRPLNAIRIGTAYPQIMSTRTVMHAIWQKVDQQVTNGRRVQVADRLGILCFARVHRCFKSGCMHCMSMHCLWQTQSLSDLADLLNCQLSVVIVQ
jgi:hypothetical protein